ncbi:adenosylcobinamide amidohydrolase [Halomonas koreensis]|uniref:Adenosylcobinamide amidohydrolase n=1 Tax=Halomonas koreensis TaxID=245385 RepID=A0ABU1G449_9GAMM|nr:adenosylcobinamide amidohydrolase [Halomonas koreensis]MDR5867707.1 adenosylcobinamide amidohydrolase [Halomonas koreensis]
MDAPLRPATRTLAFGDGLILAADDACVHLRHPWPLRTLSSALVGAGPGWACDFCNFHVDKGYAGEAPARDLAAWLAGRGIPARRTVAMMTAVPLSRLALEQAAAGHRRVLAAVTAGVGNAVDITAPAAGDPRLVIGTLNLQVFVDGHLTDGGLVNAALSAAEAKVRALADAGVRDPQTGTPATGTSTDCLAIAVTQRGPATPYAGSGTALGRAIAAAVHGGILASLAAGGEGGP